MVYYKLLHWMDVASCSGTGYKPSRIWQGSGVFDKWQVANVLTLWIQISHKAIMNRLIDYWSHYSYLCNNSDVYSFSYFIQIGKASAGTMYIVSLVALQEILAFIAKKIAQQQIWQKFRKLWGKDLKSVRPLY